MLQSVPSDNEKYKANSRFKNFAPCFNKLNKTKNVVTMWPLVSVMISYNSKYAVTVTKKDDKCSIVKMYELQTYKNTFEG